MKNRILAYMAAMVALLMSCSTNDTLEKVEDITQSHDLMRFSNVNDNYQVTRTDYSIPNLLHQNFLVSCYKNFGLANQQTVMPMYEVNYEDYSSVYGQVSWNYISSESNHMFYQEQYEKFWDYSAYPYRFFAVTPAPIQNGALTDGFNLTDQHLNVPMRFEYQTCTDGKTTAGAEPCMVAQVERTTSGRDYDLLVKEADGSQKEINKATQTLNRTVALPFHHLNSKVRFCIYCPNLGEGGEEHEVTKVTIKVANQDFVTSAAYDATLDDTHTVMSGAFTSPTTSDGVALLTINEGAYQVGHNLYYDDAAGQEMVKYYFECPNGLQQIPQQGVKLLITFTVQGKFDETTYDPSRIHIDYDGGYTTFTDVPIVLKNTNQDTFDWEKNTYYTYNIILGPFIPAEPTYPVGGDGKEPPIWFTCVVGEWENIESDVINSGQENW